GRGLKGLNRSSNFPLTPPHNPQPRSGNRTHTPWAIVIALNYKKINNSNKKKKCINMWLEHE
ncbi:hypothetical protein ACVGW3_04020, partial [Enterobacter hormaechei]